MSESTSPGERTFLVDPAWRPATEGDEPPFEAVVGGRPDLPTDPADATLRLVARGDGDGDELLSTLQDVLLGVAVDEQGAWWWPRHRTTCRRFWSPPRRGTGRG